MQRLLVRGAYVAESQVPVPLSDLPGVQRQTVCGRGCRSRQGCRAEKRRQYFIQEIPSAAELQSRGLPDLRQAGCGGCGLWAVQDDVHPASNFEPGARLPPVRMDIFYHRRVLDMPGSLPKYSGYYPSLLAVGKMIMSGL